MRNLLKKAISIALVVAFVVSIPIEAYALELSNHEDVLMSIGVNPDYLTDVEVIDGLTKYTVFNPTFNEEVSYIINETATNRTIYIEQGNETDVVVHSTNGAITINGTEINVAHTINLPENIMPYALQGTWVSWIREDYPLVGSPNNYGSYSYYDGGSIFMEAALASLTQAAISFTIFTRIPETLVMVGYLESTSIPTTLGIFCDILAANITTVAVAHAPNATRVDYKRYRAQDNILSDVFNKYYKCKIEYYVSNIHVPESDYEYYLSEQYV